MVAESGDGDDEADAEAFALMPEVLINPESNTPMKVYTFLDKSDAGQSYSIDDFEDFLPPMRLTQQEKEVRQLRQCLGSFLTCFSALRRPTRAVFSTSRPPKKKLTPGCWMLIWCFQSDDVANSRLLTWALFRSASIRAPGSCLGALARARPSASRPAWSWTGWPTPMSRSFSRPGARRWSRTSRT